MQELEGKHALITGASRGIGVYIAKALAQRGMNLTLVARSAQGIEAVAGDARGRGVRVAALPADVGDLASLPALVERAVAANGPIDLLVNNAGLESIGAYVDLDLATIDQILRVNLQAPMHLTRLTLPVMIARGGGHILNIASLAGLGGVAFGEPYCSTKHGLVGFSRSLRASARAAGYPVGVSVVCPGFVSEVGMYADMADKSGVVAPDSFGTSTPEAVTAACLDAVINDRAEVLVNPKPIRPLLLLNLLSPPAAEWLLDKMGVLDWARGMHEARRGTQSKAGGRQ